MNRRIFLASLTAGLATGSWGQEPASQPWIEIGAEKLVPIEGMASSDGRYFVAWTLRAKAKDANPVDWSKLVQRDNANEFLDPYPTQEPGLTKEPYELVDCLVDGQKKKFTELPSDWPYWPGKNRGYLKIVWSPQFKGHRYALVQNDSRFYTHNFWLIRIDAEGMHQRELVSVLEEPVMQLVKKKKPRTADHYGLFFPIRPQDFGMKGEISLKNSSVTFPFLALIPKSEDESDVTGMVSLDLPAGTIREMTVAPAAPKRLVIP